MIEKAPGGLAPGAAIIRADLHQEIARLRQRCEALECELEWMRELFMPAYVNFPAGWRLTKAESALLAALYAAKNFITKEGALVATSGHDAEVELKIVDVHVHKLRRKLKPHIGAAIETVWGRGYRLADNARRAIAAVLAAADGDQLRLAS